MFNTNTNTNTNTKKYKEYLKINLNRNMVIAESKNSVLFQIESDNLESFLFWINKKAIFSSNYSNILTVSIINDEQFLYSVYKPTNNDWKKPDAQVVGKNLVDELLKNKFVKIYN